MKKVYLLFLLALLPLFASAETVEINGIRYNVNPEAKTAEVTSNPNGYSGKVIIPKTITYGGADYRVTSIYEAAFRGWSGLTSVTIPNSVTSIGYIAFEGCSGLTSITIPTSVTSIDHLAFSGCSGLTSIIVKEGNTVYDSRDNCNAIIETASNKLISGCKNTTIPNSVTTIDYGAFDGCKGLTSITIPKSVISIDAYAFYKCSSLTSVTIPNSVADIGICAFDGCSSLTSVTIPKSVTSIKSGAFRYCSSLSSITIPNSVTSIGGQAFDNTPWYNNQPDGIVYAGKMLYKHKGTMPDGTTIKIKDGTLGIVENAFDGCSGLTSVTIPNSVTSIGFQAFNGCSGLTSVAIPNSVTSIDYGVFKECTGLTSVTIPNSVTYIGDHAFDGCSGLTSVHITDLEAWLKISVHSNPLSYAHHLYLNGVEIKDLVIPNSVTSIGFNAFDGCSGLTSITIPNSVTSIGSYAFEGCSGLTSITIPNSVTWIDHDAFANCNSIKTITMGTGINSIWDCAFANCVKLTDVYCFAENPPDATRPHKDGYPFLGSYIEYATLHVPNGCSAAYKAAETWKNFKTVVEMADDKVKLSKTKATIEKGKILTLKATVTPTELIDKSVKWKSSNKNVSTVTSAGKVKGVGAGTATITCTSVSTGAKATCKVTVGYVELDKTEAILEKGKTMTLKATVYPSTLTDKTVTWESSNTRIATVTTAGKVKGVRAGTATITCTSNATGLKATCTVNVVKGTVTLNKTEAFIEKGKTTTLKATLTPTTLEDMSVTWTSSDKTVATVSSSGKVKGVGYGTATITCTSVATGVSATCQVTIGKVVLNTPEFTLRKTRTLTLVATLYPTTLTDKSVTWKSSDTKVATVSSSGKVKGVGAGTATITCTSNATGLKGTCTVTVLAASESRSIEGDDDEATGIDEVNIESTEAQPYDVYDLSGRKVAHQVTTLEGLPNGIYIVNGKKMLKK